MDDLTTHSVMLNSFQYLVKSRDYETLRQVNGNKKGLCNRHEKGLQKRLDNAAQSG